MSLSLILFCAVLLVDVVFSTRFGVVDNRTHQYAGYVASPKHQTNNCTPANRITYGSCSGSLVNIPGFPSRRMFLTTRHCVQYSVYPDQFLVHFGDADLRLPDLSCGLVVGVKTSTATKVYTGSRVWYPALPKNDVGAKIGGIVQNYDDYALILLDEEVDIRQVDEEVVIFDTSALSTARLAAFIPVVGVAGYGSIGYGTSKLDFVLGEPLSVIGDRDKEYVQLSVKSVQDINFIAEMNAASESGGICGGDSGSAAIRPTKINGFYNMFGLTTSADYNCRAIAAFVRVGTASFNSWLVSIKMDVMVAASQGGY